jgi:hypothetical protein
MQKLADGHNTDVWSSLTWLRSRCAAAPHAGAVRDCGADDGPLHPVATPISRMERKQTPAVVASPPHPRRWAARYSSRYPLLSEIPRIVTIPADSPVGDSSFHRNYRRSSAFRLTGIQNGGWRLPRRPRAITARGGGPGVGFASPRFRGDGSWPGPAVMA